MHTDLSNRGDNAPGLITFESGQGRRRSAGGARGARGIRRAVHRIHHSNRHCRGNRSRDEMQGRRIAALAGPCSTTWTSVTRWSAHASNQRCKRLTIRGKIRRKGIKGIKRESPLQFFGANCGATPSPPPFAPPQSTANVGLVINIVEHFLFVHFLPVLLLHRSNLTLVLGLDGFQFLGTLNPLHV